MIDLLKKIILDYQDADLPTGLPRRVAVAQLPGKVAVVTGVKGCGKTTLLLQRIRQLVDGGIPRQNILYLNFTDDRLYYLRHENLDVIPEAYFALYPEKRNTKTVYCFFDEIQAIPHWEFFVDRLMGTEKCEVTVTGSFAPMVVSDSATRDALAGALEGASRDRATAVCGEKRGGWHVVRHDSDYRVDGEVGRFRFGVFEVVDEAGELVFAGGQ